MIIDRSTIIDTCRELLDSLFIDDFLDQKRMETEAAYENAHHALATFVDENKWQLADQTLYQKRFSELESELNQAKAEFSKIEASLQSRSARKHQIDQFIGALSDQGVLLTCFDETMWNVTVDEVLVKQSGELVINLKTGQQIFKNL